MLERFAKPLLIVFSCVAVSACGGGGGGSGAVPPSQAAPPQTGAPPPAGGLMTSQTTRTLSPSTTAGSAHPIQITEYTFAKLASNSGGLAIAQNGSVWTVGTDHQNNPGFLRFVNGVASWFAIPPLNQAVPYADSNNDMVAAGSLVYGEIGNLTTYGIPEGNELWTAAVSDGSLNVAVGWGLLEPDPGFFCCIAGVGNGVWLAVTYHQSPSIVYNIPQTASASIPGANLTAIAQGPDHNIWVGAKAPKVPGEFLVYSLNGTLLHTFAVKRAPNDAVAGPDGALWFLAPMPGTFEDNEIGRITTTGTATYYPLPNPTFLATITVGSDGALWFTENFANKIGRITTSGQISEYTIPTANSEPWQIVGPGSGCAAFTLWFAEEGSGKLALVRYQ